jgi:hypothetical protein
MAFFKEAPIKGLTRDRDNAKANRDRLAVRLTDAEEAVISSKSAAQRAALDGDDGALGHAEIAESAALRRLSTITAAHAESENLLALLESQIAATLDKKQRVSTAAETNAMADELIQAAAGFEIAVAILADVSSRAALISFEATGVATFATTSRLEVAAAVEVVSGLLREHAKQVLAGAAPATLRQPEAIVVPAKVAAPPTVRLFSMKPIKWSTPDGLRFAPKYAQVDLPPGGVADRALKIGACVAMDSVQCRTFAGTHVPGSGNPEDNVSLDDGGEAAAPAPSHEPIQFERVDRGKPFSLRVAAGGVS